MYLMRCELKSLANCYNSLNIVVPIVVMALMHCRIEHGVTQHRVEVDPGSLLLLPLL